MRYREKAKKFIEDSDMIVLEALIGYEVEYTSTIDLGDCEFDVVCEYIKKIYLDSLKNRSISYYTSLVLNYLYDHTIEEVLELSDYGF